MLTRIRGHVSYANVVATLALFIALGGTSVAAITLSKDSVKAKQIAKGAVGTSEVKDRALRARDFAKGQLPRGPMGLQGPAGVSGLTNLIVREVSKTVPATCIEIIPGTTYLCTPTEPTVTASCEPGERAIYGSNGTPEPVGGTPTGFTLSVPPSTGSAPVSTVSVSARLICASP
jgi:hypothetical protein